MAMHHIPECASNPLPPRGSGLMFDEDIRMRELSSILLDVVQEGFHDRFSQRKEDWLPPFMGFKVDCPFAPMDVLKTKIGNLDTPDSISGQQEKDGIIPSANRSPPIGALQ